MIQNGKSPNEQAMEVLGYPQPVFFKPNTELVKWLIEYAGERIIIDAGSGEKFLLSQQLVKNGAKKLIAVDPNIDYSQYMLWRQLNMSDLSVSFHVFPKEIQSLSELLNNKYQDILLVFARPCHSNWVEETLNLKSDRVEALYITLPENMNEYDDLGVWKDKAVLLEHKGSSADKEVIYSIK